MNNRDLLELYGFVLDKNPLDSVTVGVGLDKEDSLYGNKKEALHKRGLKNGQFYELTEKAIPEDLIYALRVYHVSVFDVDSMNLALQNQPVSLQNEKKVAQTLIDLCQSTLRNYPTSAKQDKELLHTTLSPHHNNAVRLRRAEKKILFRTLQKARSVLKQVQSNWDFRSMDVPGAGVSFGSNEYSENVDHHTIIGDEEIL